MTKHLYNAIPAAVLVFLSATAPAEAAESGNSLAAVGSVGMIAGVAVLAFVMKKFMQQ